MHGYVVKPWNYEEGKKYPVAFLIHGGPQGSFGNGWSYRWNPQTYAGQGYAVVMIDFHGSTGYGQAFTDAISQDWGGKPLEDLQKGWAAAQKKYAFLDGEQRLRARRQLRRLHGQLDRRQLAYARFRAWKCLVNHDGVFDTRSMGYVTEELWFSEWENGGTPYDNPEELREVQSGQPRRQVARADAGRAGRARTTACRYDQGLSAFTALQRKGIEVEAAVFPGREPLGAEAAEQRAVARHGQRLAQAASDPVIPLQTRASGIAGGAGSLRVRSRIRWPSKPQRLPPH